MVLEPLLLARTKEGASPLCTLPSFMSASTRHLQHALKPCLLPGHFRLNRSFQKGLNTPLVYLQEPNWPMALQKAESVGSLR